MEQRRLCGVSAGWPQFDDIPPVHHKIAANGNKNRHADRTVLEGAIAERAAEPDCAANTFTRPRVTVALLNCFRGHPLTTADGTFGKGLSPFAVSCEGHPESIKLGDKAREMSLMEQGSQAPSASDLRTYSMDVAGIPEDNNVVGERLEAFSCVLDIFLGVGHPVAAGLRQALIANVAPYLRTRIRTQIGDDDKRQQASLRVMFWVHTHLGDYIEEVQQGSIPTPLDFQSWAGRVRRGEYNLLADPPSGWFKLLPKPKAHSEVPPASSGTGGGGTAAAPQRTVNPRPNAGLKERWDKSGLTSMKQLLDKRSDSTKAPKLGGNEACLTWLLRGGCLDNCHRKGTHKTSPPALIREVHDLLDHCGVPKQD
jgi:hypothetical protein